MIPITFKKLISMIFAFGLLMTIVSASAPPVPMPVVIGFTYDGLPVQNFRVSLKVGTETVERITNEFGKVAVDIGTGSPDFKNADYSMSLTVQCGFDVCNKNYIISQLDSPTILNYVLAERPPTTCPPQPSCGGCSGGGGVIYTCTESKCAEDYPCDISICDETVCQEVNCPAVPTCPTCPAVPTCPTCDDTICPAPDDCPEPENNEILIGLIALVIGSGGMYFLKRGNIAVKNVGIKIYTNRNGVRVRQHRHPGIKGYHEPMTVHRDVDDRHPKGQLDPEYEKNSSGKYVFVR